MSRQPCPEPVTADGASCDAVEPVWKAIRDHLENLKKPVDEAIRAYPPPIPACDAQYNHLLEQRDRIGRELARLDALMDESGGGESAGRDGALAAAEGFMGSSPCIDDAAAGKIKAAADGLAGRDRP
ncbi:MAG: hypothetical protein ACE5GT_12035 [Rhodospirillales bacterium]